MASNMKKQERDWKSVLASKEPELKSLNQDSAERVVDQIAGKVEEHQSEVGMERENAFNYANQMAAKTQASYDMFSHNIKEQHEASQQVGSQLAKEQARLLRLTESDVPAKFGRLRTQLAEQESADESESNTMLAPLLEYAT